MTEGPGIVCARCLLDTTVSSIRFDPSGICQFCANHDKMESYYARNANTHKSLAGWVAKIKAEGKGKPNDCIVGVSGGTDSTYTLMLAKNLGLRPLAVHFDNGWDTDEAVTNIRNITSKLDVDLITYVVDWEEFKSLQVAFLKAGVPCVEAPTDVGIHGALMQSAEKEGLRYVLGGQSFRTEGTVPREWSYLDGTYIRTVHKRFGSVPLRSFPNLTLWKVFYYTFVKGIRQVPLLNYIDYDKGRAKKELAGLFGWQDYGGHHYESLYSKFAFGWYLPRKFNIDKRKVSLSGPVRSGLMPKADAVKDLQQRPDVKPELVEYVCGKLGLSKGEFDALMAGPSKSYTDYFTSDNVLRPLKGLVKLAVKLGYFTPVLYQKYFE